jgi:hypothetical protein
MFSSGLRKSCSGRPFPLCQAAFTTTAHKHFFPVATKHHQHKQQQLCPPPLTLSLRTAASRRGGVAEPPPPEAFVENVEERELHVEASESYLAVSFPEAQRALCFQGMRPMPCHAG